MSITTKNQRPRTSPACQEHYTKPSPDTPSISANDAGCKNHVHLRGCSHADGFTKASFDTPTPANGLSCPPAEAGGQDTRDAQELLERVSAAASSKLAISVTEAAKILSISKPTAYQLVRSEGFPAFRLGGRILVSVPGLLAWIERAAAGEAL